MKVSLSNRVVIAALVIVIALMAGYIGVGSYSGYVTEVAGNAYVTGYSDGMAAAVQQILQESDNCQPVPVYMGNLTRTLIDVACLQEVPG